MLLHKHFLSMLAIISLHTQCFDSKPNLITNLPPLTCDSTTSTKFASLVQEAEQAVNDVLEYESDCLERKDLACSAMISQQFVSKAGSQQSLGQRILIMDDGFHIPALVSYPHRVLEYQHFTQNGDLEPITDPILIHKTIAHIHEILTTQFTALPASLFTTIDQIIAEKIPYKSWYKSSNGRKNGHGTYIFTKLAEYNPEAEFVLIDKEDFSIGIAEKAGLRLCEAENDPNQLETYRNFMRNSAKSIRELIEKYDIDFLNFSFSSDVSDIQNSFAEDCPNMSAALAAKIHEIDLVEFFTPLYTLPNTLAVQAIFQNTNYHIPEIRKQHRVDCTAFPNSIRVAGFGRQIDIPNTGMGNSRFHSEIHASAPCTDLAINLGPSYGFLHNIKIPECFVHLHPERISKPEPPSDGHIASSYATSIAISYLIYLRKTLPPETSLAEIKKIATGDSKRWIQDPIRHRTLELYRLGYMDL